MKYLKLYKNKFGLINIIIISTLLSGCDLFMSDDTKINIAEKACAEAEATRRFESARRVKLINDARSKIGKGIYPMNPDPWIEYGDCLSTILDKSDLSPSNHWRID
jgi:hypothetical protein|tara:strand:- start:344 stop:661 length:318 start_codon:yes stop_codon:yes gene_type:complete